MHYSYLNMLGELNMTFNKKQAVLSCWRKWFNLNYGKDLLFNFCLFPGSSITGFKNYHTCQPYCKKTLEEVWAAYPEALDRTCRNRFRSREDVCQYIFRWWRLMKGEVHPHKPNSAYLTLGADSIDTVDARLSNRKCKVVCVNDDPMNCDFETEQKKAAAGRTGRGKRGGGAQKGKRTALRGGNQRRATGAKGWGCAKSRLSPLLRRPFSFTLPPSAVFGNARSAQKSGYSLSVCKINMRCQGIRAPATLSFIPFAGTYALHTKG